LPQPNAPATRLSPLSQKQTLKAVTIGRLRARYLEAAFQLGINEQGDPPKDEEIAELKRRREMFEEARNAFDALRDAIEKGYVDIASADAEKD
jgi:hypothetical protein